MTKSRNIHRPKWAPSEVDLELVRRNFATCKTEDLATACGVEYHQVVRLAAKLGLKKSEAFYATGKGGRLAPDDGRGAGTRFPKGLTPWNKGKKLPGHGAPSTFFKPGHKGGARAIPVGGHRINPDGYAEVKLNDNPGPYTVRWKPVHRLVWEQAHGEIPDGHIVVFRPGQKTTDPALITVDRLECITHAENMRRNTFHRFGPEVAGLVQLRGALTRQINRKTKELAP